MTNSKPATIPGIHPWWSGFLLFWLFIVCPPVVHSDYISMSGAENAPNIAEVHINDDHVKVVLEIYIKDLATFHHLLPDEFFRENQYEALITLEPLDGAWKIIELDLVEEKRVDPYAKK